MIKIAPKIIPIMMAMIEYPHVTVTVSGATLLSLAPLPINLVFLSPIMTIRTRKKLREISQWKTEDVSISGILERTGHSKGFGACEQIRSIPWLGASK